MDFCRELAVHIPSSSHQIYKSMLLPTIEYLYTLPGRRQYPMLLMHPAQSPKSLAKTQSSSSGRSYCFSHDPIICKLKVNFSGPLLIEYTILYQLLAQSNDQILLGRIFFLTLWLWSRINHLVRLWWISPGNSIVCCSLVFLSGVFFLVHLSSMTTSRVSFEGGALLGNPAVTIAWFLWCKLGISLRLIHRLGSWFQNNSLKHLVSYLLPISNHTKSSPEDIRFLHSLVYPNLSTVIMVAAWGHLKQIP